MIEPNGYHHNNGNGNSGGNGNSNGQGGPFFFDSSPSLSDDLRRYLGLIWHWAWLIIILTALATAIGYFLSKRQVPVYRASATLLINESRTVNEYANILASERLAQTYSQLIVQKPVLEGVVERLDLNIPPESLKGRIFVDVVQDTQLMVVSVEDSDPVRAAQIANTIGEVFAEENAAIQTERYQDSKTSLSAQLDQVDQQIQDTNNTISELEGQYEQVVGDDGQTEVVVTFNQQRERDRLESNLALYQQIYSNLLQSYESVRLAEIQSTSTVRLAEEASVPNPDQPIRPNVIQDTSLAAVVGLLISIGLVFVIEVLDDTIKGPEEVARHLGLPVLGYISEINEERGWPITAVKPRTPIAEAFRSLRTNIQYASVDRPIRTLLVTSPSPKDGKSTIATNLATVIAQSGRQVALFDADMRRPSLHSKLRLSNRVGLSDLFVQANGQLASSLRETKVPGLGLLTSGSLPPNPAELVGSEKMAEIMRQILTRVDIIVVDTPPVMAVTDAAVLAPRVDGVLLVLRPGATKIAAAKQTVETLARGGANILGVVLNGIGKRGARYYYYRNYYVYNQYYGDTDGVEDRKWMKRKKRRETTMTE
jgi:succinoglycan biosynthesis transport protein ExoP